MVDNRHGEDQAVPPGVPASPGVVLHMPGAHTVRDHDVRSPGDLQLRRGEPAVLAPPTVRD